MRSLESIICKRLALLAIVGPFIFGPLCASAWGPEGAIAGVLLPVFAVMPLALLAATVLAVTHHIAERRELRENLASPAACRTMSKPRLGALVSAAVLFSGSAPFLLAGTVFARSPALELRSALPAGVLTGIALLLQWVGMQRIGDYLLARRAWRETRPPASPQK